MVNAMLDDSKNSTEALKNVGGHSPDLLKPLTKPLTNLVVQVDKKVLIGWSFQVILETYDSGRPSYSGSSLALVHLNLRF